MDADPDKRAQEPADRRIAWPPAFMLGIGFGVEPPELGSADEDVEDTIGGE